MQIIRARVMGFCMGVKKAVDAVEISLKKHPQPVYTLGALIHNDAVLKSLKEKNVHVVTDPRDVTTGTIIIRAHGVTPEVMNTLSASELFVNDATCPLVKRSQEIVSGYAARGFHIYIVGDPDHAEIIGLRGYAGELCHIIPSVTDAATIPVHEPAVLLAQTTIKISDYDAIISLLSSRMPTLVVEHTICPATEQRQEAAAELARQVDAVLVIAGRGSSNTKQLVKIVSESGKPVWLVESSAEIPSTVYNYSRIGLTAGASTPDWIIDDIEAVLINNAKGEGHDSTGD